MKSLILTTCLILILLGMSVATTAQQQETSNVGDVAIFTGTPVNFISFTQHRNGQPVTVYEFVVSLVPMNLPPPWPAGLWIYLYVQVDQGISDGNQRSSRGNADWCRWWINQVAADQRRTDPTHIPYPYFQINTPAGMEPIQTDEGFSVFPPGSVSCWEAQNSYGPGSRR
jgi:hypothetical protein